MARDEHQRRGKVEPALTNQQWEHVRRIEADHPGNPSAVADITTSFYGRLAGAAALLHGQPFGFTRGMVDALRESVKHAELAGMFDSRSRRAIENLEALLPPPDLDTGVSE